ncbi:glycosyltransferase family 4 protein [Litoribaculum gwangyangense]|uniref:Glycosyl transferase family 1 domain-containing protein n=1 Tax=Litoribaculum gwangyangense TaxID=1130722 RepID=A0ABP9CRJ6_9FLAO
MRHIVYIGNKANDRKKTNVSSIDILSSLLKESGFVVFSASHKKDMLLRLIHMLYTCLKYRKEADYVLIDTYSTLNFYYAYFVSQFCRVLKLKYIPILHGGNLPNRLKNSPKLSKAIFNHAFKNIAPSEYIKSQFINFGFHNIKIIPNAIDLKNYPFKERTFEKVKLLWVRSFSKIYNPLLAVKILKTLKERGISAELCMVGPDSDGCLNDVKEYAKSLGLKVTFTGKLNKEDWISLSKNYNIFINTTNFDNTPVSVIEAMALGLPVISTNVGGIPFLIENQKTGILVAPNSVESFITEINKIMTSPEKANHLAMVARKKVEDFDWSHIKTQWIKVLH